jgi:glycosyltransferase involved in cell wall biosynthesis
MIECVVVCVDYSDFLAWTLPLNKNFFDRMIVITSTKDKATQRLCEHHYVECVQTDVFYENGEPFNKGRGINVGLSRLTKSDWIVHMDADIVLPPETRNLLNNMNLDKDSIYGIDRFLCNNYREWINHVYSPKLHHQARAYIHTNCFPIGTRIYSERNGGYIPIGFFQLWNVASCVLTYPEQHTDAGRSDMLHAMNWPRSKRSFLPEIIGIHLATGHNMGMGVNWKGRTTPKFGEDFQLTLIDRMKRIGLWQSFRKWRGY